jgi:hypothetical protein
MLRLLVAAAMLSAAICSPATAQRIVNIYNWSDYIAPQVVALDCDGAAPTEPSSLVTVIVISVVPLTPSRPASINTNAAPVLCTRPEPEWARGSRWPWRRRIQVQRTLSSPTLGFPSVFLSCWVKAASRRSLVWNIGGSEPGTRLRTPALD